MAYTNPWVNNIPLGTDPANTADDQLRRLRLDIFERMNDIVQSWTVDPVAAKTRDKRFHWSIGAPNRDDQAWRGFGLTGQYVTAAAAAQDLTWRLPVFVPAGATITEALALIGRGNSGDIVEFGMYKVSDLASVSTVFAVTASAVADPQELSSGALTEVVDSAQYYWMRVYMRPNLLPDSAKLFGVRLKYTLAYALQGF